MSMYSTQNFTRRPTPNGFTIVELLIVIVVIGILAAITIVAFNGVSNRAKVASIQSDLTNASKQLKLDQVTASAYPATTTAANNGQGLKSSSGTTYQYSVDNSANPPTFCLTATNGSTSYYVTQDNSPVLGICPDQVSNPVITNLAVNPSLETNLTNWSSWAGTNGNAYGVNSTPGGGYSGAKFGRLTWTVSNTVIGGGPSFILPATPTTTYTASVWVRSSKAQKVYMEMKYLNGATVLSTPSSSTTPVTLTAGVWTNISYTSTAPALTTTLQPGVYASNTSGGALWLINDYIDYDAALVVTGSTLYNFADGDSSLFPGWSWNGTANASSSYGPSI